MLFTSSLAIVSSALLAFARTAPPEVRGAVHPPPRASPQESTVFALEYGTPLLAFTQLAVPAIKSDTINHLQYSRNLATPNSTYVVMPNVDTLYASTILDLSENDIVVEVPPIDDRYWNFAFYDPFGNNFANIGSVNGNSPGEYTLSRLAKTPRHSPQGSTIISPGTDSIILIRILVKNNTTDLAYVRKHLELCRVRAVKCPQCPNNPIPPLTLKQFAGINSSSTALAILNLTAAFNTRDPSHDKNTDLELIDAGIWDGVYHPPPGVDPAAAYSTATAAIQAYSKRGAEPLGNGWSRTVPQGVYGLDYIARAFIADVGYLELAADQALYPMWAGKSAGSHEAMQQRSGSQKVMQLSDSRDPLYTSTAASPPLMNLTNKQSYLYTFSSIPPLAPGGFWSLTLYNATGYLVPNQYKVYSVGDRSNITYPDGSPVYGTSARAPRGNQYFQVLVQGAGTPPPENWTANWLPAPSDGANFSITFRLYAPKPELRNGKWAYPTVVLGDSK